RGKFGPFREGKSFDYAGLADRADDIHGALRDVHTQRFARITKDRENRYILPTIGSIATGCAGVALLGIDPYSLEALKAVAGSAVLPWILPKFRGNVRASRNAYFNLKDQLLSPEKVPSVEEAVQRIFGRELAST
ncbi:MAG: hypothetical protein RLN70_12955, partial [Rhodospirillaceae bacterium]